MPQAEFYTAASFTDTWGAGNPAGVVFHNDTLAGEQMRAIAGELQLETAFLSPPAVPGADYTVAYYTGAKRIPFCGHDTVAAAAVLVHSKRLRAPGTVRFATDAGIVPVTVNERGDITLSPALPVFGDTVDAAPFLQSLGVDASALHPAPAQIVSAGTAFVLLGLRDERVLPALHPNMASLAALQTAPGAPDGLYVWSCARPRPDGIAFHARCFCPGAGLPEDPVTGSATAAFSAYAVRHRLLPGMGEGQTVFRTEQGRGGSRLGHVAVSVDCAGGEATQVQVTGRAVVVSTGMLFL